MKNLLRGRDSDQKIPDLSLYSYHYVPHKKDEGRLGARKGGVQAPRAESPSQNHTVLASLPHLLATIPLNPTSS